MYLSIYAYIYIYIYIWLSLLPLLTRKSLISFLSLILPTYIYNLDAKVFGELMNKETLVLLVSSVNSVVGFRKHNILHVISVIPVFLHPLSYFFWPRAREVGSPLDIAETQESHNPEVK